MEWQVLFDEEFEEWFWQQEVGVQDAILMHVGLLKQRGPALSRPYADTLYNSTLANLKELCVQYQGNPWRVLFVFDPKRQAILLVGGNKAGQNEDRWYKTNIKLAEERYKRHLKNLEQSNG